MAKTVARAPWTKADLKKALKLAEDCYTLDELSVKMHEKFGRSSTGSNLKHLFLRNGLPSPIDSFKQPDPIERVVKREDQDRLRAEHKDLVARLREAEERQVFLDHLGKPAREVVIKARERKSGIREGMAVAMASDWHVEEYVPRRADTAGNFYDLTVADKRVTRYFEGLGWLIEAQRHSFAIRDLMLWLGGDLITGYLRDENLEENELSPVQAISWLKPRLCAGINHLLEKLQLERIVIPCSHGNHGRTTEKRSIATGAKNSYEWLLYQWLADHYRDEKRVQFITDESNHQYATAYDFNLHFHHGDEIKYQGGVGGIAVPLMKAVAGWNDVRRCHYHHMGHWHQYVDYNNVTVNGSLIGYNAYAMSIRAPYEPPQQAFYVLDSKRGKTAKFPIWVGE